MEINARFVVHSLLVLAALCVAASALVNLATEGARALHGQGGAGRFRAAGGESPWRGANLPARRKVSGEAGYNLPRSLRRAPHRRCQ